CRPDHSHLNRRWRESRISFRQTTSRNLGSFRSLANIMRDKFIAGNWKMNTTREETAALIGELIRTTASIRRTTIMVAPPFTNLATAAEALVNTQIKLGAQNMCWEDKGPFTGEVSGPMLRDVGCQYVIIGHSERRHVFGETDADVNRKVRAALRNGLLPILS